MSEKSISFNEEMLKAILDGHKTQTRRVINPQPNRIRVSPFSKSGLEDYHGRELIPKYNIGDIINVKEDKNILLKIISIRAERLQDITEDDAFTEGLNATHAYITPIGKSFSIQWFKRTWNSIYGKDDSKRWEANPYVWVYEFERC